MKYIKYFALGLVFGLTLTKAEVVSWYRIQEMFRFQSFHMYGVIGTAVVLGIIGMQIGKRRNWHTIGGEPWQMTSKAAGIARYLSGGILFGLGWALTGACPGPLFILLGQGQTLIALAILAALGGNAVYGLVREKLPH
jgi:hypothetical protein